MSSQLLRGAGVVALGTATGQGIILLSTPFLARLYTPAEFGQLGLIASVSNIAVAAGCARFDLALPGAADRDARPLLALCAIASVAGALVTSVGLVMAARIGQMPLVAPFGTPLVIAICIALAGLQQAAIGASLRRHSYRAVGAIRLGQGVAYAGLAALPGIGLVWAHALSFAAALPALFASRRPGTAPSADRNLVGVARRHLQFPLQSLPGAVLDVVGYSICLWTLTVVYGNAEAGHFSQVQRIVGAPLMLVGMSVGQVLLRHSVDLTGDRPGLRRLMLRILAGLSAFAALTLLAVALFGSSVLGWVLGAQWRVDTEFLVLIAIAVLVRSCVSPLTTVLVTLRRFDLGLAWQATYFLSAVTLMPWVAGHVDSTQFLRFYAVHECVFYAAYLALVGYAVKN